MRPGSSAPPDRPRARFVSWREAAVAVIVLLALMAAHRLLDEWRGPIGRIAQLFLAGLVLYFGGRIAWWWWDRLPPRAAMGAVSGALAWGIVSWLDTLVAGAVRGMSEGNYALIVIAPLAMLLGLAVSLVGLLAAAVGGVAFWGGLTRPVERRGPLMLCGALAIALNLGAIVRLVTIFG